jgi:SagB-type dehydrogenase family enzyme
LNELLRLRRDASWKDRVLLEGHIQMRLDKLSPGLEAAMDMLAGEGAEEDALDEAVGEDDLMALQLLLRNLETKGWLERSLPGLATLTPVGHQLVPVLVRPRALVLSRFAYVRRDGDDVVVETPKASVRLVLHDQSALPRVFAPSVADPLGRLLARAGIAVAPEAEDGFEQEQWQFHDLLQHARSRVGRHLGDYGGSYRFESRVPPLPVTRPQFEPSFALAEAEPADPLSQVLAQRRSIREHDDEHPLTKAQLGEFLGRVARQRETWSDEHQELSSRPYPSGGAAHELELYPLVRLCEGLEPALYHYDPAGHTLGRVAEPGQWTMLLLEYARGAAVMERPPQVVLLVTARFGRVTWKYESMAYALVLKHVGVLYQTMYLVATAMGLAPCALGGSNSDAFAAATGLDYYAEPHVGEFVLGSRPG